METRSIDSLENSGNPEAAGQIAEAERLLAFIERQTARMVEQTWQALALLFDEKGTLGPEQLKTYAWDGPQRPVRLADLERYAPQWSRLVPADPDIRASLAFLLSRRYRFTDEDSVNVREALGSEAEETLDTGRNRPARQMGDSDAREGEPETWEVDAPASNWLDPRVKADIESEVSWVHLDKGETLMRRGDPGDAMYILVNGRLRVTTTDARGDELLLTSLGTGAIVGEMAILTGDPRTATVQAARDSELVRLSRAGFTRLVELHPRVLLHMVRVLARRLTQQSQRSAGTGVTTITIAPVGRGVPLGEFCRLLADALARFGPTLHLDSAGLDAFDIGPGGRADFGPGGSVTAWLNDKEAQYRYVIYETDPELTPWTACCLRQADRLVLLFSDRASPVASDFERELLASHARERELVVLHEDTNRAPVGTKALLDRWNPTRHYHVRLHVPRDVDRVARAIVGRAIGLVLGGGGVRCFAQIGVLRALEEAGVPIDYLAGSSGGAVIAAQYAMGWDMATIVERNKDLVKNRLLDYTFPLVSLLSARGITRALDEMFGEYQIEDLYLGYFSVSSDLVSAQVMTHRSGSVRRSIRASIALPGLVPPLAEKGALLVDGVVLNNMPVAAMQELCQGGPVIAVDVSMAFESNENYDYGESLSGFHLLRNRLNPFSQDRIAAPGIIYTLLRSMELHSEKTQQDEIQRAALYLNPPVAEYSAFNPKPAARLVEVGYEYARDRVAEWARRAQPAGPIA